MARRGTPSPFRAGLACRCPRCGRGPLFTGYIKLRPACPECGLDYGSADSGDGPAALIVEAKFQPPMWVHAAIWLPVILGGTLLLLRPLKATMIALQFHHRAGET